MFDVNQFTFRIGDPFDFFCIGVVLATIVDLQLYTKISVAFAVENWFRFVVVIMDHAMIRVAAMAAVASCRIIVFILIIGIVLMDCPAAVGTGCVIAVIASAAQRRFSVPFIVIRPNPGTALFADNGFRIPAGFAQQHPIKLL